MRLAAIRLKLQHLLLNKELRCLKCGGRGFLSNVHGAYRGECLNCTFGFLPRNRFCGWILQKFRPPVTPHVDNSGSNLWDKNKSQGITTQTKPGS